MKKLSILATFLLICVFIITGCGGEETTTAPATTTAAPATTTPAKTTVATTTPPTAAPKYGGILKVAIGGDGQRLGDSVTAKREDAVMQRAAVEYLGRYDSAVTLQPYLAESWQGDAAALTFTVNLKQGIKFHDGTDFNAAAVKWNWERHMAESSGYTKRVTSIDVVSEYTVRANLDTWDSNIESSLCYWGGAMVSPTPWETNGAEWGEKNPVGTGPFKFVEWVRDTKVTFTKFDGYWQEGLPYLDGVEFDIIVDATVSEASFRAGDVDASMMLSPLNADNLKKEGKYVIDECNGVGVSFQSIYNDGGNPGSIFSNVYIRKAVGYAIDREKIVKSVLLGYGKATNQKALPGQWGYNPDMEGQTYDPAKAREMLTLGGYPNGINTTLTVMSPYSSYMEAVQAQLKEVGINTELVVLAPDGWRHLLEVGWTGLFHCIEPIGAESGQKFTMFTSETTLGPPIPHPPEVLELQVAIRATGDFETMQQLVWQGQALVWDELALNTALWIEPALAARYPYVHNIGFMQATAHASTLEQCWMDK